MKRLLFAAVAVLGFFLVLEGILALAGVRPLLDERDPFQGFSESVRVYRESDDGAFYETRRRAVAHSFNYQRFAVEKPAGGLRLFVLGGSSAYGFPWGAGEAFTGKLGEALAATRPERTVEAINAAAMSYGSHRLRILVHELLDYEPDLLVVYSGHNEFVERRFYEDVLERPAPLDPLRGVLYRWRLYSGLSRLGGAAGGEPEVDPSAVDPAELLGFDVDREYTEEVRVDERAEVERRYEENLEAIADAAEAARVPLVLCTVASNIGDWRPNQSVFAAATGAAERASLERAVAAAEHALQGGDVAGALEAADAALAVDGGHARAHFLRGGALEGLGRGAAAREAYLKARDLDGRPSRAMTALNEIVRRVASRRGLTLVDVERRLEASVSDGLVGFNLLEDYVHPKPAGHRLIAFELWRAIVEAGLAGDPREADQAAFAARFGDPFDFDATRAPDAAGDAQTPALLYNLAVVLENQGQDERAMVRYRECLALDPSYVVARFNLARLLTRGGNFAEAAAEHRRSLETDPRHVSSWIGLGEALRHLGRLEPAQEAFTRATELDPSSARPWNRLGVTLAQLRRHELAEGPLRRAVELAPDDAAARTDLGYTLLLRGDGAAAAEAFRLSLELNPGDARTRNGLAAALVETGALDEAERLFRRSLELDPADGAARYGLEVLEKRRGP